MNEKIARVRAYLLLGLLLAACALRETPSLPTTIIKNVSTATQEQVKVTAVEPPAAAPTGSPIATAAAAATTAPAAASTDPADIIFTNGVILTMDKDNPIAESIAIRGDKILAVGANQEVLTHRGEATLLISLDGRTLMPGFVDAHSHMLFDASKVGMNMETVQEYALENGITTSAELYVDQSFLNDIQALSNAGKIRLRFSLYLMYDNNCGDIIGDWYKAYQPGQKLGPRLEIRGVKIFADGGSCKVPAVTFEYPGGNGDGDLFLTQEQINQAVAEAQAAGFQVAIHSLGDRSLEQAQDAIAAALNGQPNIYRHRIEHNAVISPKLLPRYSQIGIIPVIFGAYPTCIRTRPDSRFKYLVPVEYGTWEWPWRLLLDANPGLPIAWHADYPIFNRINPLYNMYGMVTRNEVASDGSICEAPAWLKQGALRIEEVLPMMTINSAYALFRENEVGSLAAGKLADLIILSDNPLQVAPEQLKDITVLMTMLGGKVEYCAAGSEPLCPSSASSSLPLPAFHNLALNAAVTASASLPDSPAANAVDGSTESIWSSGTDAEQWIQIDLGQPNSIDEIRLTISQYPAGYTVHQVWVGASEADLHMVHEFAGNTVDPQTLIFRPPASIAGIRYIRVVTKQSPSWVAWREIEVIGN